MLILLAAVAFDSTAYGKSGVPYGRGTVISTESAGVGATLADLSPPSPPAEAQNEAPAPQPTPSEEPTPEPAPSPRVAAARLRPARATLGTAPPSLAPEWEEEPTELLREEADLLLTPEPGASPSTAPRPRSAVLNIGTRLTVVVEHPVTTSPAGSQVSARLRDDVIRDGAVLVARGTPVEGLAFATDDDDRVQMAFRALIAEGKTVPLRGVALGEDGAPGVPGKVVRKGSRGKSGVGRVLGAVGRVASFGLLGGDNVAEDMANDVLRSAGRDLGDVERRWRSSDKVLRLAKGATVTVYLESDVTLP